MQRRAVVSFLAGFALAGASAAFAQDGDLGGVTMRVLDDVSDIDAVVLAVGGDRAQTDARGGESREPGQNGENGDAARGDGDADGGDEAATRARAEEREQRTERAGDRDERGEGELEDNDVEREPVEPPAPVVEP